MEAEVQEKPETSEVQEGLSIEDQARAVGWKSPEEFKGDPSRAQTAEEFMAKAQDSMPLLRAENAKLKSRLDRMDKDIKKASEFYSKTEERAYQRAVKELQEKRLDAVASGDTDAFVKIDEEISELGKDIAKAGPQEDPAEVWDDWRGANAWYDKGALASATETEADARIYATRLMDKHVAKTKEMSPSDFFAMIEAQVKEKYPDLGKKPAREKPASAVAAPTGQRGVAGGKTFADLPPDAQRICDRFVKSGLIKNREQYLKDYDWS